MGTLHRKVTQLARPVGSRDTYHCGTCPARGISGSGSTGTCFCSSSESCSSCHTSRTPASCGSSGGRNPAGREQGDMEQQCLWFGARLVCYPQELQGGSGGGALGPSDASRVSIPRKSHVVAERSCRGRGVGATHAWCCDCASSPQRGTEEQVMGQPQPAGMSGRIWAANTTLLDLLQGKEFQRNIQAAESDPREINTQLTADLQHTNYFQKQSQGPYGDRWICLTQQSMTRQGLGRAGLSPAAFAVRLYLPHSRQGNFLQSIPNPCFAANLV